MLNIDVSAADLPKLQRLEAVQKTIENIQHLASHRNEKVVYLSRYWTYEDLVALAHEYYVIARQFGVKVDNFFKWLEQEREILTKRNLPWPVK